MQKTNNFLNNQRYVWSTKLLRKIYTFYSYKNYVIFFILFPVLFLIILDVFFYLNQMNAEKVGIYIINGIFLWYTLLILKSYFWSYFWYGKQENKSFNKYNIYINPKTKTLKFKKLKTAITKNKYYEITKK